MSTTVAGYTVAAVKGYRSTRRGRNVLHRILGTGGVAVTVRGAGLRTGSLTVLMPSIDIANSLVAALSTGAEAELVSTDRPNIDMQFVVAGDTTLELDPATANHWWVIFDWQETD